MRAAAVPGLARDLGGVERSGRGSHAAPYDPIALWRAQCAATVEGSAMEAAHFIPEELPVDTAARLAAFLIVPAR